jgi:hypothetical protein
VLDGLSATISSAMPASTISLHPTTLIIFVGKHIVIVRSGLRLVGLVAHFDLDFPDCAEDVLELEVD